MIGKSKPLPDDEDDEDEEGGDGEGGMTVTTRNRSRSFMFNTSSKEKDGGKDVKDGKDKDDNLLSSSVSGSGTNKGSLDKSSVSAATRDSLLNSSKSGSSASTGGPATKNVNIPDLCSSGIPCWSTKDITMKQTTFASLVCSLLRLHLLPPPLQADSIVLLPARLFQRRRDYDSSDRFCLEDLFQEFRPSRASGGFVEIETASSWRPTSGTTPVEQRVANQNKKDGNDSQGNSPSGGGGNSAKSKPSTAGSFPIGTVAGDKVPERIPITQLEITGEELLSILCENELIRRGSETYLQFDGHALKVRDNADMIPEFTEEMEEMAQYWRLQGRGEGVFMFFVLHDFWKDNTNLIVRNIPCFHSRYSVGNLCHFSIVRCKGRTKMDSSHPAEIGNEFERQRSEDP